MPWHVREALLIEHAKHGNLPEMLNPRQWHSLHCLLPRQPQQLLELSVPLHNLLRFRSRILRTNHKRERPNESFRLRPSIQSPIHLHLSLHNDSDRLSPTYLDRNCFESHSCAVSLLHSHRTHHPHRLRYQSCATSKLPIDHRHLSSCSLISDHSNHFCEKILKISRYR